MTSTVVTSTYRNAVRAVRDLFTPTVQSAPVDPRLVQLTDNYAQLDADLANLTKRVEALELELNRPLAYFLTEAAEQFLAEANARP